MPKVLLIHTLVVASVVAYAAPQESRLSRAVREHGDLTLTITSSYDPVSLQMVVKDADTIIIGRPVLGTTFLVGEDRLWTNYDISVDQVIRRSPPGIVRGDTLVVRRAGGAMTLEGHNVVGVEDDFPQFTINDTYVLFLKRVEGREYYSVAHGPQGAFHVNGDSVRQVSELFGSWNRERGTLSLRDFVSEVLELGDQP